MSIDKFLMKKRVPIFPNTTHLNSIAGCSNNFECSDKQACIENMCQDPCKTKSCGLNAECRVLSRVPTCFCRYGYFGNSEISCQPFSQGKNWYVSCVL